MESLFQICLRKVVSIFVQHSNGEDTCGVLKNVHPSLWGKFLPQNVSSKLLCSLIDNKILTDDFVECYASGFGGNGLTLISLDNAGTLVTDASLEALSRHVHHNTFL